MTLNYINEGFVCSIHIPQICFVTFCSITRFSSFSLFIFYAELDIHSRGRLLNHTWVWFSSKLCYPWCVTVKKIMNCGRPIQWNIFEWNMVCISISYGMYVYIWYGMYVYIWYGMYLYLLWYVCLHLIWYVCLHLIWYVSLFVMVCMSTFDMVCMSTFDMVCISICYGMYVYIWYGMYVYIWYGMYVYIW